MAHYQNLGVGPNLDLVGDIDVGGNADIDGTILVSGDCNFDANVVINGSVSMASISMDADVSVTAHSGGGNASATAITKPYTVVATVAAAGDSVILPATPTIGQVYEIVNAGASDCAVYPGAGDSIDALGADNPYYLATGSTQRFLATSSAAWTRLNRGLRYVNRAAAAVDFTQVELTVQDGTWTELDTSSILPLSTASKPVAVRIYLTDAEVDSTFQVSDEADGSSISNLLLRTQVAATNILLNGTLPCSSGRKFYYAINEAITAAGFGISGYWVEG